jgi:serine/threonine protein kinase
VTTEPARISRIGKYEIVRVLGSGGAGVVYEAVHPGLKKRVAIKTLHPKLAQDSEALRRFLREGEAASRIRHPHVVDINDVGVHEGQPFLVMELLEGRDLKAYLAERGPQPLAEAVDLMLPIIAAVGAGHAAGVVHRDLKPHNIFIASRGGVGPFPKVLDFGVSKMLDPGPGGVSWSGAEAMMGTLCYMSPEQVRGHRHLDARVDQYALGLILYECLTAERVHAGDDQAEIVRRITEGQIERPRARLPELPAAFESALLRALASRPDDRFPGVQDFGRELLPFAGGRARLLWRSVFEGLPATAVLQPPPALPATGSARRRRFLRPLALAAVPVAFLVLLASRSPDEPRDPPPPPAPTPARPLPPPPRATVEPLPPPPGPTGSEQPAPPERPRARRARRYPIGANQAPIITD